MEQNQRSNPLPKNRLQVLCICLGVCLLLGAAALTAANFAEQREAEEASALLLRLAEERISHEQEVPAGEEILPAGTSEAPVQEEVMAAWETDGILSIPDLGLRLPVLADCSDDLLKLSVCVYQRDGGREGGRMVIAGHNYRAHFGTLSSLVQGAAVSYTRMDGEEASYQVAEVTEIAADDYEALEAGEWDMTLLTCNLDMTKRILVRLSQTGGAA
jgi:sortase A